MLFYLFIYISHHFSQDYSIATQIALLVCATGLALKG